MVNIKNPFTYNYVGGFFMFNDSFFKKVEDKSGVNKKTIMSLASKLQHSNMKDENVLRDLVKEIGAVAGKEVRKIMFLRTLISCYKTRTKVLFFLS